MLRKAFAAAHQDIENILQPEEDLHSGAFARIRACPQCQATMVPLRLGIQLCWVDWCNGCGLLWVEKLDEPVLARLERRTTIERAVISMPEGERRVMASELAGDIGQLERERRQDELTANLNRWFRWWWM